MRPRTTVACTHIALMPELPEVETVRRGLRRHAGRRPLPRVDQNRPDLRFPFPEASPNAWPGAACRASTGAPNISLAHLDDGPCSPCISA